MKRKASAPPTAEEGDYHDWLRAKGWCEACGARHDLVIHHILAAVPGKNGRRDHWFVVLICAQCHNMGTVSVHLLGSEEKFYRKVGVDLVFVSIARLKEYRALRPGSHRAG